MIDSHRGWNTSFKPLVWGLICSLIITFSAYFFVSYHVFTGWIIAAVIFTLCLLQSFILLVFYMHLLHESKPRWNLMLFLFLILVVVVIIGGTLWIMSNLDYNTMPNM